MATAQLGYFSTRGSCMTWQQSVASFRWCVLVSSSITWVEMAVFDLKLGLVVVRNVFPCGQEHLSLCGWRDTIAECGKDREHGPYITTGNMYARQWKHLSRFPAAAPEHQLPAAGSCPAARPHQEAPRGERPAGFHRINKTVTHKDRRRKGQTLVHNRRATAQPKELSECSWRTDSHTHTQTSTSNLCTCSYWRLCVSLTSAWFSSFGVKRFIQETLTHLAILYKQHADGVLGAEVEYVNVVLNSHLREWLHPRRGGERRMTGWGTRSNMWVITLQVPFKDGHCWFMCAVYWIKRAAVLRNLSLFHKHTGLQSHWISRVSSQKNISKHHLIISNTTHFYTQPNKLK